MALAFNRFDDCRLSLSLILLMNFWGSCGAQTLSEIDLKDLADAVDLSRANEANLWTWEGAIASSFSSRAPRYYEEIKERSLTSFVYDRPRNAFRSNSTCLERLQDGKESFRPCANILVLDGAFHKYAYDSSRDFAYSQELGRQLPIRRTMSIVSVKERPKPTLAGESVDPIYWWTIRGKKGSDILQSYIKWVREQKNVGTLNLSRDGSRIELKVSMGAVFNRFVVDPSVGGNLVEYESFEGEGRDNEIWKWEYKSIDGVWVPAKVSVKCDRVGGSTDQRTLIWILNIVNKPIDLSEFSFQKLGLRRGDTVNDRRTNTSYKVVGAEFPAMANGLD